MTIYVNDMIGNASECISYWECIKIQDIWYWCITKADTLWMDYLG